MRRLIVNADDYGRTEGINRGTIEAHRSGVVTSATVMILEAAAAEGIREALREAPRLALGLHCMLTGGGAPASDPARVPTLAPAGKLARNAEALPPVLDADEVRRELEAQIALFEKAAGKLPSHLDSHHHCALHPSVEPVFGSIARELGIPARAASAAARHALRENGVRTPDFFFDGFYGHGATVENLLSILDSLPEGSSELMCHPGHADPELLAGSSYAAERDAEIHALTDPRVRARLTERGVVLISFDAL
ncbi:MAG TPA: ChbG/HpnK family deacetylase [Thermoanaerobaculia bacterium]|nr:ChbG/HpnK family deacetylase [Thermoanaerobaculia bacterium]